MVAVAAAYGIPLEGRELALLCQRVENAVVGRCRLIVGRRLVLGGCMFFTGGCAMAVVGGTRFGPGRLHAARGGCAMAVAAGGEADADEAHRHAQSSYLKCT